MLRAADGHDCRLRKTKRLRALFEQMDTARTGALTLDQFKEYLARENPRSIKRAHDIFLTMKSGSQQESSAEDASLEPRVTFIEVRIVCPS